MSVRMTLYLDLCNIFNHGSADYTGISNGHVPQCLDVTSPPVMTKEGGHINYTEGYVLFENGHTNYYRAYSGPAIPFGKSMFTIMMFTHLKMTHTGTM